MDQRFLDCRQVLVGQMSQRLLQVLAVHFSLMVLQALWAQVNLKHLRCLLGQIFLWHQLRRMAQAGPGGHWLDQVDQRYQVVQLCLAAQ